MILTDLKIHHLRNISSLKATFHPRFNFIIGPNGSGKTSLLEALYILSCGHSFRTREISPIIAQGESTLTLFAKALNQNTVSIQKSSSKPTLIKLNNQFCNSTSQLAYALPCQIFYSDMFQIIDTGPAVRRSVLDWGLFHVKPNYLVLLKEYKKILKHRNALLRSHAPYAHFIPWDHQLSSIAEEIHELRNEYFARWNDSFAQILPELTSTSCFIRYYKGWDRKNSGISLKELFAQSFEQDNQRVMTHYGSHQADILIESEQTKAKHYLSRGQQKIILFALKLAQTHLLEQECLFLVDDFSAELDLEHQTKLINYFNTIQGQFFITSTTKLDSARSLQIEDRSRTFYIEHGNLS